MCPLFRGSTVYPITDVTVPYDFTDVHTNCHTPETGLAIAISRDKLCLPSKARLLEVAL